LSKGEKVGRWQRSNEVDDHEIHVQEERDFRVAMKEETWEGNEEKTGDEHYQWSQGDGEGRKL